MVVGASLTGSAFSTASAAQARVIQNPKRRFLGVLPSTLHRKTLTAGTANGTPPLTYHGGPVVHSSRAYAIFWKPATLLLVTYTK